MRRLPFTRKPAVDPLAAIEAEIAGMETSKTQLEARIPALEAAKADALARRRDSLIAGAGPEAEAEHARAAREADDNLAAVADALAALDTRLADANGRLAQARDQIGRDAAADELERDCQVVDAAAKSARDALASFRKAADALTAAVTPLVAGQAEIGWRTPPERVGTILVANLLAAELPAFKISTRSEVYEDHWHYAKEIELEPEHAADPVGAVLTERLRTLAADIRAGTASSDLHRWKEPEPKFRAALTTRPVYVIKPFSYQDGHKGEIFVAVAQRDLPVPLADFALKARVATEQRPANWDEASKPADPGTMVLISERPSVRLAFDLAPFKTADIERQSTAWRAERGRAAA